MVCLRILIVDKILMPHDTGIFLKAGSGLDEKSKPVANFIHRSEW